MWTLINCVDILAEITPGSIIAQDPDLPETFHIVKIVTPEYIKAVHKISGKSLAIHPQSAVIAGKWWVHRKGPDERILLN